MDVTVNVVVKNVVVVLKAVLAAKNDTN